MFSKTCLISCLGKDIRAHNDVQKIRSIYKRLPVIIKALVDSGSNCDNLTRIITRGRCHSPAFELPLKAGFTTLQIRFYGNGQPGEQTLATDQDNAIIFENLPKEREAEARTYLQKLGKRVNLDLDAVDAGSPPGSRRGITFLESKPGKMERLLQ